MTANTDTRPVVQAEGEATSVRVTPVVEDRLGRAIPKGTKGIVVELADGTLGVLDRVEYTSRRFVVRTDEDVYARSARRVKVLRAHGRFVKAAKLVDLQRERAEV